jgi:hypothetical protein
MMQAFVYKWTHKPTLNWYVGVTTGKKKYYISSSKVITPMIKLNPEEWEKTIIAQGEYPEMLALETEILQATDARNDLRSFNQHNNEGGRSRYGHPMTEETKKKIGTANKGKINPFKGISRSDEDKLAISKATIGVKKKTTENSNTRLISECPHCNKKGNSPAMYRWHFNNCKEYKTCS